MMFTANNIYPLNLIFHIVGLIGWVIVAVMWNDRALIIINTIGLVIYINGMLQYVMGSQRGAAETDFVRMNTIIYNNRNFED